MFDVDGRTRSRRRFGRFALALSIWAGAASCAPSDVARKPVITTTQPVATPREIAGVRNFAWVTKTVSRGAQPTRAGFETLKSMGVKTVIDLRGKSHRDEIDGLDLKYVQVPSSISKPDEQQFVDFLRLVRDPHNLPVFVHDDAGADRVGLYVAVYRMVEQGWTSRDARAELDRFHFNPFWTQVPTFLDRLDVESLRHQASLAPSTRPATTRAATRRSRESRPSSGPT